MIKQSRSLTVKSYFYYRSRGFAPVDAWNMACYGVPVFDWQEYMLQREWK